MPNSGDSPDRDDEQREERNPKREEQYLSSLSIHRLAYICGFSREPEESSAATPPRRRRSVKAQHPEPGTPGTSAREPVRRSLVQPLVPRACASARPQFP